MSTATLQQTKRRVNTAPPTLRKARRLVVTTINKHTAFVRGDHGFYEVAFDRMTCSCDAGKVGTHCAHVQRAVIERAKMSGWEGVIFCNTDDDVVEARRELRHILGTFKLRNYDEHGYRWVTYSRA